MKNYFKKRQKQAYKYRSASELRKVMKREWLFLYTEESEWYFQKEYTVHRKEVTMYDVRQYAHDHGIETFEVFDLAWRYSHFGNRCRQGEVPRDHTNWLNSKGKVIPWYVLRYIKSNSQLPTMPKGVK